MPCHSQANKTLGDEGNSELQQNYEKLKSEWDDFRAVYNEMDVQLHKVASKSDALGEIQNYRTKVLNH